MIPTQTSGEAYRDLGRKAYQAGNFSVAENYFRQAQDAFNACNDSLQAAEMANDRCVALLQDNQPDAAYQAVFGTEHIFEKAGDKVRQAMTIGNQATALDEMGKVDDALDAYRISARLFAETDEKEYHAHILKRLSALLFKKGKRMEAIFIMQSALDLKPHLTLTERFSHFLFGILSRMMNRGNANPPE